MAQEGGAAHPPGPCSEDSRAWGSELPGGCAWGVPEAAPRHCWDGIVSPPRAKPVGFLSACSRDKRERAGGQGPGAHPTHAHVCGCA